MNNEHFIYLSIIPHHGYSLMSISLIYLSYLFDGPTALRDGQLERLKKQRTQRQKRIVILLSIHIKLAQLASIEQN